MARSKHARVVSPFAVVVALGLPVVGITAWWSNRPPADLPADHAELVFQVDGLDCAFWCPVGVDAAFAGVTGVRVLGVDVRQGSITVAFDPDSVSQQDVTRRIAQRWPIRSVRRVER